MNVPHEQQKMNWTFLTNHAHVLLCLARSTPLTMREIAMDVGITERAVQRIVADLRDEGYITPHKEGRCNSYDVHVGRHLKHPIEEKCTLADLIKMIEK